ncbi:MAG: sensor histidine kinase [Lachnospiraceae bacterium]|nr:sensor histidine kinase [Lachnospiraceae bacterium]
MRKEKKRNSPDLRNALLRYCLLGLVLPVTLLGLFFSWQANRYLTKHAYNNMVQAVDVCASQLENAVYCISYAASYLITDADLLSRIQTMQNDDDAASVYSAREALVKQLRTIRNTNLIAYNPEIAVILPDGSVSGTDGYSRLDEDNTETLFGHETFRTKYALWYDPLTDEDAPDLVSYWKIYYRGRIIGLLRIHVPEKTLWDNISSAALDAYDISLYNGTTLISHKKAPENAVWEGTAGKNDPQGSGDTEIFTKSVQQWDMSVRVLIPREDIYKGMPIHITTILVVLIVFLILLFVSACYIAERFSQPIARLERQMEQLQQGDTSTKPVEKSFAEIEQLSENLNQVAVRIDDFINKASEDASEKANLYYQALMSQIRPHFLYNTLNSIRWMAMINNNTAIADMLSKLGNHLRYSLDRDTERVTFEAELAFLNDYFSLQQMRFGNNIRFSTSVPDDLMDVQIPRFCIQPFIENAFSHGFEKQAEGVISLKALTEAEDLVILIDDNGKGADPEKTAAILNGDFLSETSNGIGIANVHRRLQLLYGSKYGIRITTRPNEGFHVMMKLKIDKT